ncbi:MAG: hypothetical protein OXC19_24855, partial [Bryobacterales bacterium]|nr:hypothetical protein [Bryobacterales bacterium]
MRTNRSEPFEVYGGRDRLLPGETRLDVVDGPVGGRRESPAERGLALPPKQKACIAPLCGVSLPDRHGRTTRKRPVQPAGS